MLVQDGVHCLNDGDIHVQLLIGVVDAVCAVVTLGYHLHLQLCGFDGVTHSDHLPELTVTTELRVRCNEHITQISAGTDVAMHRTECGGEVIDLLQRVADQHGLEVVAIAQTLAYTSGNGVDVFHHRGVLQADYIY